MIRPRRCLTVCALLFVTLGTLWGQDPAGRARPGRPSVVFLLSDDQSYDTVRALGNAHIQTPHLDRLAGEGFTFTHTYCMGSTSGAVCRPSRAMIMSGRTLFRVPFGLPEEVTTLPELLGRVGHRTFGTGKWHNGRASFARSFQDGDAIFFGGMSDHERVPVHSFDPTGKYLKSGRRSGRKFSSELFADEAIRFLDEQDGRTPFFVYVAFTAPHDPRTPPAKHRDLYDPAKIPLPANFLPEHPFDNGELVIRDENLAPVPREPEVIRQHLAEYYGMISHLDEQVGRILEALDRRDLTDSTYVVFTSDHGLAVGQHGLLGKQNVYEHSTRVPLILRGPGIPAGERSSALAYLFDVFPTLCELLGVVRPLGVEGRSLVPIVKGERAEVRESLYCQYKDVQRSVRDRRYKRIEYEVRESRMVQLFDLEEDPLERNDLSSSPEHAEVAARLEEELLVWRRRVVDPGLERGRPIVAKRDGSYDLTPWRARLKGERIRYQPEGDDIGAWSKRGDTAEWILDVSRKGRHRVVITYGCKKGLQGFVVQIGEQRLSSTTRMTGGWRQYVEVDLGEVTLAPGETTVSVRNAGQQEWALFNLRRVSLVPTAD